MPDKRFRKFRDASATLGNRQPTYGNCKHQWELLMYFPYCEQMDGLLQRKDTSSGARAMHGFRGRSIAFIEHNMQV